MQRFNIPVLITGYGMTDTSNAVRMREGDELAVGFIGALCPGYECRVVDKHDIEVPVGEAGELVVRAEHPWSIATGYLDDPAASIEAWRNGWFHTGDLVRENGGRYFFVDRIKDALRRRGENISAEEVEAQILGYPGIAEVACVPYRDPSYSEDEVKAWIVCEDGASIDFAELMRDLTDRMPYFMIPRFYEIATELP